MAIGQGETLQWLMAIGQKFITKTKYWATWTPLKNMGDKVKTQEIRTGGKTSSCSITEPYLCEFCNCTLIM
jgi:hypothetical protein